MAPQDETAATAQPLTSAHVAPADSSDEVEVPAPKPTPRRGRSVAVITGCAALATLAAAAALSRLAGGSRLAAAEQPRTLYDEQHYHHHRHHYDDDGDRFDGDRFDGDRFDGDRFDGPGAGGAGGEASCAYQNCDCSWASGGPQGSCSPTARDNQPCWRCCCRNFISEGGYEGGRLDGDRFDGDRFEGNYGDSRGSGRPFPGWEGGEGGFGRSECEEFEEREWVRVKSGMGEEDFRDAQIVERRGRSMYEVIFHGGFRKTVSCHRLEAAAHPIWQSFISFVLFLLAIFCCVGIAMAVIKFINKDKTKPMIAIPIIAEEPPPSRSCFG